MHVANTAMWSYTSDAKASVSCKPARCIHFLNNRLFHGIDYQCMDVMYTLHYVNIFQFIVW